MAENKVLNETTVIQFNLKWFIGTILSLLISLGGFYFTIVKPDNEGVKDVVEQRFSDNEKFQDLKFEKLDDMNQLLGDLEIKVDALQKRNTDLDALRASANNTGASF